ncbi:hypothetical protein PSY31_22955, partial [Shigella flexneri]|nr:hypothetical protein [Shigella flexneri]
TLKIRAASLCVCLLEWNLEPLGGEASSAVLFCLDAVIQYRTRFIDLKMINIPAPRFELFWISKFQEIR